MAEVMHHPLTWPEPHAAIDVPTRYGPTHLEVSGPQAAPPVLLIPAMGVTSAMWLPNSSDLSRQFRMYAVDTIGDLGSSKLHDSNRYPKNGVAYSQWLIDVLDAIGVSRPHIVGSSMGGWIAMDLAIHAPARVNRLVLLGPMGLPSWLTTAKTFARLWKVFLRPTKANVERAIRWALGDNPSVRQAFAPVLEGGVANRARIRLAPPLNLPARRLRRIAAPCLLILGEVDNVTGSWREVSRRARRYIPEIQIEVIPGVSHLISTEAPTTVNALIQAFLQEALL